MNLIRRFLPAKFALRERILLALAVVLAVIAIYLVCTARSRAAGQTWIAWQFLGTVLFVAIAGRERAFFTGLYCILLTGSLAALTAAAFVFRMPRLPDWGNWASNLIVIMMGGFGLVLSIVLPVAFAWGVTALIRFLEKQFSK